MLPAIGQKSAALAFQSMSMRFRASRSVSLFAALAAMLAAAAPIARAQSLKALRAQEAEEAALSREVGYTSSVCGTSIDASIDWRSTSGWPEGESLASACDGALGAIEAWCRSGAGKARAQSISNFVCAGDGAGPYLRGSTFRYGASPGDNGFSDTASYLEGLN